MCIQYLNAGSLCKIIQACCFSTGNVALNTDLVKNRVTLRPTLWQSSDSVLDMPPAHSNLLAPYAGKRLFHEDLFGRCDSPRPPLFPSLLLPQPAPLLLPASFPFPGPQGFQRVTCCSSTLHNPPQRPDS